MTTLNPFSRKLSSTDRKKLGIYYTPVRIAKYMVEDGFTKILENQKKRPSVLKIIDPSCGNGVFINEVLNYLINHQNDKKIKNIQHFEIQGIDVDKKGIEIAKRKTRVILPSLQGALDVSLDFTCQDLLSVYKRMGKYDIVLGNPPYISWSMIPRKQRVNLENGSFLGLHFNCRPNHQDAQPNLYLFFLQLGIHLLKDQGILSFLLPREWLFHPKAKSFRNFIVNQIGTTRITEFDEKLKIFNTGTTDVGTTTLIFSYFKNGLKKILHGYYNGGCLVDTRFSNYNLDTIEFNGWKFLLPEIKELKHNIQDLKIINLDNRNYFEVRGGFQPPVNKISYYEIGEKEIDILSSRERKLVFPAVFNSKEIKQYHIDMKSKRYWIVVNEVKSQEMLNKEYPKLYHLLSNRIKDHKMNWWHFPNIRNMKLIKKYKCKLLSPRTASYPTFAIDCSRSVFKGTNTMIISKVLSPFFVAGILNSNLSAFWYHHLGSDYHGGNTRKFEPSNAKKSLIPIVKPTKREERKLSNMTKEIHDVTLKTVGFEEKKALLDELQSKINQEVMDLYRLNNEQRKLVENHEP